MMIQLLVFPLDVLLDLSVLSMIQSEKWKGCLLMSMAGLNLVLLRNLHNYNSIGYLVCFSVPIDG